MDPVGIFDSGVGGMSLFLSLRSKIPSLPLIYVADTANFPYGNKNPKAILRFSEDICRFFVNKGAQAIICGCNTASSAAVPILQQKLSIPLFGVIEPAVEHIIAHGHVKRVGIIGTATSIQLGMHKKLLREKAPHIEVFGKACPKLAPAVELGASQKEKLALIKECLEPLIELKIDSLLIACTHYTFLLPYIRAYLPKGCHIFDTTEACIDSFLQQHTLSPTPDEQASYEIISTGKVRQFKKTLEGCLPYGALT